MSAARISALETEVSLLRRELGAAQERLQAIEAREAARLQEAIARPEGLAPALEALRARAAAARHLEGLARGSGDRSMEVVASASAAAYDAAASIIRGMPL